MKTYSTVLKLIVLLYITFSFSQNGVKTTDSLKKYGYLELENKILKSRNDNTNGFIYAKEYLSKAKKENNSYETIYGYIYLGDELDNFNYNLKYSDSAIALSKKEKPENLTYLYYNKGKIFYREKRLKEALNCFLMARKYSATSQYDLTNTVNYSIGLIKNTQGNYEEAIEIYKKCIENSGVKFDDYPLYLLGISELYQKTNKIEISEHYIEKGIEACKINANGNFYLPYFISSRGKNHFKRKEYQKAINDLTTPLKHIQENKDFSNYAENSFYLGECYRCQKNENKAIQFYKKVDSVFILKKDIYLHTIPAYIHLIEYYKSKQDYKNVAYYSEQFIKADKVLDDNYKYISAKIAKTYDIEKILSSKQNVISSLKKENVFSKATILTLILILLLLSSFIYYNNKKKKKELKKQKEIFENYIEQKAQPIEKINLNTENDTLGVKKNSLANIDDAVIAHIMSCLDEFELKKKFLEKEYTVEMLASEFKTNSNYLSKVINELKNSTFTHYINTLRIDYILEKLQNDSKFLHYTIQALSEFSGYNSAQTFTRAFINHTKMKPSFFIKELKNKKL